MELAHIDLRAAMRACIAIVDVRGPIHVEYRKPLAVFHAKRSGAELCIEAHCPKGAERFAIGIPRAQAKRIADGKADARMVNFRPNESTPTSNMEMGMPTAGIPVSGGKFNPGRLVKLHKAASCLVHSKYGGIVECKTFRLGDVCYYEIIVPVGHGEFYNLRSARLLLRGR